MLYKPQAKLQCEGCSAPCTTFTTAQGTLTDGPDNYNHDAICEWMIAPPNASLVIISFAQVYTEAQTDRIFMYECSDLACTSSLQVGRVSGRWSESLDNMYASRTGYMKLKFTSNENIVDAGFVASWTSVSLCTV